MEKSRYESLIFNSWSHRTWNKSNQGKSCVFGKLGDPTQCVVRRARGGVCVRVCVPDRFVLMSRYVLSTAQECGYTPLLQFILGKYLTSSSEDTERIQLRRANPRYQHNYRNVASSTDTFNQ